MKLFGYEISRAKAAGDALPSSLVNSTLYSPNEQFRSLAIGFDSLLKNGLFSNPAVAACIATYATTLAEAPLVAVNAKDEFMYDDPVTALFSQPNRTMSGALLWSYVATYVGISGNAYLYKLRDGRGRIAEIHVFSDAQITPVPGSSISQPLDSYLYKFGNEKTTLAKEDVIHIRGLIPDPQNTLKSLSPIRVLANSIDAGNALDELIYSTLRNHATPNTVITTKEALDAVQAETIRSQWNEKFGIKRGQKLTRDTVAFLPAEMDVKKIGMNFDELESEKLWGKFESAVCSIYRIDPIVAQVYTSGENKTYSNYREAMRGYTTYTRIPVWNLWEEQIELGMRPDFDTHVEFDTRYLQSLQPTPEDKQATAVVAYEKGIITRNEARGMIGFDPIANGDAFSNPNSAQVTTAAAEPELHFKIEGGADIADFIEGMSEDEANVLWKAYDKQYEKHGKKIAKDFAKVAGRLETAFLTYNKSAQSKAPFDWEKWYKEFKNGTNDSRLALVEEIIQTAWSDASLTEEIGTSYDNMLQDSLSLSTDMISESVGTIRDELKELIAANPELSSTELADLIRAKFEVIKSSRADAIGRTTATATAEGTKDKVWKEANSRITDEGKKIVRVWLSRRDAKTRSAHLAADGQAEDDNGEFTLNGHKTPYPAGRGLPSKDAVNCRCVTIAVRKSRLKK